jgi:hypothetical protein
MLLTSSCPSFTKPDGAIGDSRAAADDLEPVLVGAASAGQAGRRGRLEGYHGLVAILNGDKC